MKVKLFLCLSFCFSLFLIDATATTLPLVHNPVGTYDFVISDIPDQPDLKGTMVVSKSSGRIIVTFNSSIGEVELADAKLDGHKLTGKTESLIFQGIVLKLNGKFTSNGFEGQFNSEFGALSFTASKK